MILMPYLQRIAIEMLFLLCCFDLFCRDINMAYINLDFSERCREIDFPAGPQQDNRNPLLKHQQSGPLCSCAANSIASSSLVAIHGLGGHAYKTWREGEKLWLRDFLPHDVPTARVLTFGYNAGVAFTQSKSNIRDFATSLLEEIRTLRRRNKEADVSTLSILQRKMIFVCHSLGGIVFKQALVIAHEKETRYGSIKEAVAGVIFLGTPHRGADIAYWSKLLAKFANVLSAGKMREDLLKALAPKSTELGTICSQFVERGMRLQIFSLYERHETSGLGSLAVDEFSAILYLPNETPIPMEADHRGLCKYLTPSDSCYRTVFNCIEELMDSLIETSEQPCR
ncbi:Uncharacterized protein HZ326_13139 [Fusarium oxysporum f. sp. albedinis]|nr:Uncharacterized protein HZ326_13139 [Fusarium oxysporum f. sp. albedinis]